MNDYPRMVALCHIFLDNQDHPSRKAHTEDTLRQMYEWLRKHYEPAPPALGVSVSERIRASDKVS